MGGGHRRSICSNTGTTIRSKNLSCRRGMSWRLKICPLMNYPNIPMRFTNLASSILNPAVVPLATSSARP